MASKILLDNTVLSNFAFAKRTDLPFLLWPGQVCPTEAVMAEYQIGSLIFEALSDQWQDLPVVELTRSEAAWVVELPPFLGAGEAACLAVALNRNGILANDDRKARKIARRFDILVMGSVGILLRAVEKELLSVKDAQRLLEVMIAAGYRSPIDKLDDIL